MEIEIEVRQEFLGRTLSNLKEQMSWYGQMYSVDGDRVILGDRFNIRIAQDEKSYLPSTWRKIFILPKDTPL